MPTTFYKRGKAVPKKKKGESDKLYKERVKYTGTGVDVLSQKDAAASPRRATDTSGKIPQRRVFNEESGSFQNMPSKTVRRYAGRPIAEYQQDGRTTLEYGAKRRLEEGESSRQAAREEYAKFKGGTVEEVFGETLEREQQKQIPLSELQKQFYADGGFEALEGDLPEIRAAQALGMGVAIAGAAVIGILTGGVGLGVLGAVAVGGGLTSAISGYGAGDMINRVLGRETSQDLQSSINTIGQMASTISGTHRAGGISKGQAIAELKQLDDMLLIVEHKIQKASILDPTVKISGQYVDILTDLADQRSTIREGVADVLEAEQSYDPQALQSFVAQIEQDGISKRQLLIDQGYLKGTL